MRDFFTIDEIPYFGDPETSKRRSKPATEKAKPKKYRPAGTEEQEIGDTDGGVMMTTSEILDFYEGSDS